MTASDVWTLGGLLGPSDDELNQLRARYGLLGVEAPGVFARIGRGMTDVWEPIKQTYLNLYHPEAAAAYAQQRAEDEALYQRGRLADNPQWADPDPMNRVGSTFPDTDWLRVIGRLAPSAPFLGPAAIGPAIGEAEAWDTAQAARKWLAATGVLPSWLGQ